MRGMVAVWLGAQTRGTQGAARPDRLDPPSRHRRAPGAGPPSGHPPGLVVVERFPGKRCSDEVLGDVARENEVFAAGGQNLAERGFDPGTFGL